MKIGFLHTSPVHVSTFDGLLADVPGAEAVHDVEEAWLRDAAASGLTPELCSAVAVRLQKLARATDAVICTCSTLGPIAGQLGDPRVFRVDEPMMAAAADHDDVLLVVCLRSTIEPSSMLLERAFAARGREPSCRTLFCADAWKLFEGGDLDGFGREIAANVRSDLASHAHTGCVVLAQASMRVAAERLADVGVPVLSSPEAAVAKALALAHRSRGVDARGVTSKP